MFLIVGCGVFGLSTALDLAKRGHRVVALDRYPVPSKWSAANDLNKIIRTEYSDISYTKLSLEALDMWETDPLYSAYFIKCGRITLRPSLERNKTRSQYEEKGIENLLSLGKALDISEITKNEEIDKLFPGNCLKRFSAKYNPQAGYGRSADSLVAVYNACLATGNVEFRFGDEGYVKSVNSSQVVLENGKIVEADKILVACGAASGGLINLGTQTEATGLFITHIVLSEAEYEKYKDIPIFFSAELGYFFPPDRETRKLKIALTFADASNYINDPFGSSNPVSLPRYKTDFTMDTFPRVKGEAQARDLLHLMMPDLEFHKFTDSRVCWVSDTCDSNFLIDVVPYLENVFVASGDSGHGYKFLPNIGKYIAQRMEGALDAHWSNAWRWRESVQWPEHLYSRAEKEHLEIGLIDDWIV